MKYKKKHTMILLTTFVLLILSVYGIHALGENLVYRDTQLEMKNEINLLNGIRNLKERFHPEEGIYFQRSNFLSNAGPRLQAIYLADSKDYQETLAKYELKDLDKIKIDPNYKSKLPLEHEKFRSMFPNLQESASPVIVIQTADKRVVSYSFIDGRMADFSKIIGQQITDSPLIKADGKGGWLLENDTSYRQ